ncbi:MAG: glutamate--tRNA ligase [Kiritimatiellia bacterium]
MTVRVRFAPSPTGRIHIGNVRVAIFNWLFARHEGGRFLLRIEDTDRERCSEEAERAIFDVLEWLGLDHDEEPVYQSRRTHAHLETAEALLKSGAACREDKGGTGRGECVVFKMPDSDVSFTDEVHGKVQKKSGDLSDFVIVRSDGTPVFHLANIVDDIHMGITHIIRGDDHMENTFRHIAVYRALGADVPRYAHLPMVVNHNGKPYSKRDGDFFVGEFREKGFHPDALFNYLALLGWSPGDDREKMTRAEMIKAFSLDRVKSSPARMDLKKLTNLNARYVAEMPLEDFIARARAQLQDCEWAEQADPAFFRKVAELMQSRTHLYSYAENWKYFFAEDFVRDEKTARKALKKEGVREALGKLSEKLAAAEFTVESLEEAVREVEDEAGVKRGKLNFPVRAAVTGISTGAGIFETMALLGRERVITRLKDFAEA